MKLDLQLFILFPYFHISIFPNTFGIPTIDYKLFY